MAGSQWTPPSDYRSRPVLVIGAGVLGRRVAACWMSGGYDVNIFDLSAEQQSACLKYLETDIRHYIHNQQTKLGHPKTFGSLEPAVKDAWLVIEAVPEKLPLKIDTFANLEALAPADAILASNSSSYKSSQMIEKVGDATKARILNTHYYMPPSNMMVELMTDGHTAPGIFPFMVERQREAGTMPFVARKESTGFIFNRLWAAIKRETLNILAEGVSVPEEIDEMWSVMVAMGTPPCRAMDAVGLDTVAFIEDHYVDERKLPTLPVDWLRKEFIEQGKLGLKSTGGGLYPPNTASSPSAGPKIFALDIGLAASPLSFTNGQLLEISTQGRLQKVVVPNLITPDGIDFDAASKRLFWTSMGTPGKPDGTVCSAALDGSDVQQVLAPGLCNTPKQLVVEPESKKLYFSDREGLRVFRCNLDGSDLETLVQNGDWQDEADAKDQTKWCVGISVSRKTGKFYWTQKGAPKSGQGRIFCADIDMPAGQTASSRTDVQCLLRDLPEPIDLELDEETQTLYWTDRGELPFGNALYAVQLGGDGLVAASAQKKLLVRGLHEAIGVKLDSKNRHLYVTDLGGALYRCDVDGGNKKRLFEDSTRALVGLTVVS